MNEFLLDLERGRTAEVAVTNAFRRRGYDVMDMTKNPAFWKKDIDLLIYDHDGTIWRFEVKNDYNLWKTANVCLELTSKTGKDGWFKTTEASHIAFVDLHSNIAYIARTHELREYVYSHHSLKHMRLNGCDCVLVNTDECFMLFQRIEV